MADDISGIDVDALINGVPHEMPMDDISSEVPGQEISAPEQVAQAPIPNQPESVTPQDQQVEKFVVNGKEIHATKEQLIKWAQMGYDAPNKIGEYNKKFQEFEQKYKPYLDIDEYAKQNPQWWEQVQQGFAQREAMAQKLDPNNPLAQELTQLKSQLNEFGQFKNKIIEERTLAQYKQEDDALETEIKSIQEKFSDLDWKTANEQGHNLERQILTYATQRGIGNFQDAFRAYYFDKALSRAEERGKETVGKAIQKQVKAGIIGKSPTPNAQIKARTNFKDVSYEDLLSEAKQELGI